MRRSRLLEPEERHVTEHEIYTSNRITCPTCGGTGTVVMLTMPKHMGSGLMGLKTWLFWMGLGCSFAGVFLIGLAAGVWWLGAAISTATTMPYAPLLEGMGIGFALLGCGVIILVEPRPPKASKE